MIYDRNNPFIASLKGRELLSKPGSLKKTYHLVIDLKGSSIEYRVGDSIAIYPENEKEVVELTLKALKMTGDEKVVDKLGQSLTLRQFLTSKANLTEVNKRLFTEVFQRQKKEPFEKEELKQYLSERYIWDFLCENEAVNFSPQEFISFLMPLLPRFYSIASSQKKVGEEVHLTIAAVEYISNGNVRRGVCTHYLCHEAPLNHPLPIYIQPHNGFTLPEAHTPIVMIGPGTGVAPFRAFMQERHLHKAEKNWLFFGERNRATDFLYEDFWQQLKKEGLLQLDVAFSRDQEHKLYVQHRMEERGQDLYEWLEKGAHLYVCGDAKNMAKDVEDALLFIIQKHGKKDENSAKEYLKHLRKDKRYLRDVY